MLDTTITLVGNLVDNPEHRTTTNGASVCSFRLASTPRRFDRSENRWVDGATLFLRVSCWRQLADNVAESLARGDRALVYGRLRQRSFETSEGERRVSYEIDADAIGTELTWHAARSQRLTRGSAVSAMPAAPAVTPVADNGLRLPGGGPLVDLRESALGERPEPEPLASMALTGGGEKLVHSAAWDGQPIGVAAIGSPSAGLVSGVSVPLATAARADGLGAGSAGATSFPSGAGANGSPWRSFSTAAEQR
ncbi:single-stranded DNA-binding protein [Candidatus Frankia alpina]|uniref:Single-stranded DNA-binding protein n=1 Tax=Candidatus Frankia alpina TaxID=2699483 RepID=A0A4S5EET5_9ACTN|nr:single-stranded DNA-binding protein [Candidatus Frankia alpina]THJ70243.1 single-stranded DNA-binding protein [Candidatus Frankia alpina]